MLYIMCYTILEAIYTTVFDHGTVQHVRDPRIAVGGASKVAMQLFEHDQTAYDAAPFFVPKLSDHSPFIKTLIITSSHGGDIIRE